MQEGGLVSVCVSSVYLCDSIVWFLSTHYLTQAVADALWLSDATTSEENSKDRDNIDCCSTFELKWK